MQAVRRVHRATGGGEQALVQHVAGPVVSLFARLEHEQDIAGQFVAMRDQQSDGADQAGHVKIVSARVHRPTMSGISCGSECFPRLLDDG